VSLVSEGSFGALGVLADAKGYFVVQVAPPPAHYRGRFGLFLEEAIEGALDSRGALAPGIQSTTGLDASLADQLYRTRLLGYSGLVIGIPNLESIANLGRVLDADDSSVLRWWIAASLDRPVRLLIHEENTCLRVYQAPVMFEALFGNTPASVSPRAPSVEMAESAETMELSDLPPRVSDVDFETSVAGTRAAVDDDGSFAALDRALGLDLPNEDVDFDGQHLEAQHAAATIPCPPGPFSDEQGNLGAEYTPIVQGALFVDASDTDIHEPWLQAEDISPSEVALVSSPMPTKTGPSLAELAARVAAEAALESERALNAIEGTPSAPKIRLLASDFYAAQSGLSKRSAAEADPAPTPLPTKKITRNPFVRFAEPHELSQVASGAESRNPTLHTEAAVREPVASEAMVSRSTEPADGGSVDELPSELPVRVVARMPIVHRSLAALANAEEDDEREEILLEARLAARKETLLEEPALAQVESDAAPTKAISHESDEIVRVTAPSLASGKSVEVSGVDLERQQVFTELARRDWRKWLDALEGARGPRPLSAVERMFVTDYTRLAEAYRLGIADDSAVEALTNFRQSFAESYTEAFDALRARGKRPTMVLDLPDMAHRIGRLQGARRVQLLLVDGLRFDLGLMLQDRLKQKAEATLTERLLLWSALPTCTSYQLELLGKGPEGLKEAGDPEEPPALVARGRAAMTPRRVRTGSLELFKLDVVEDGLRELDRSVQERLPEIADRAAEAVLDFFAKQAPKTLVMVFGDHGFALDPTKAGTSEEVVHGGSSPEEVLVPAFAWLTGRVH